jgi:hypothetical protein
VRTWGGPGRLEDLTPRSPLTERRERLREAIATLAGGAIAGIRHGDAQRSPTSAETSSGRRPAHKSLARVGVGHRTLVRVLEEPRYHKCRVFLLGRGGHPQPSDDGVAVLPRVNGSPALAQ